jgi:hypothetical protein
MERWIIMLIEFNLFENVGTNIKYKVSGYGEKDFYLVDIEKSTQKTTFSDSDVPDKIKNVVEEFMNSILGEFNYFYKAMG